jgi:hypothetical protein
VRRIRLVIHGKTVRRQPPVVGDYCWPPSSGKVDAACAYESAACTAGQRDRCKRCGFPFCANHFPQHIRKIPACPPDAWRSTMQRLRHGLDLIAKNPKRPLPSIQYQYPQGPDK